MGTILALHRFHITAAVSVVTYIIFADQRGVVTVLIVAASDRGAAITAVLVLMRTGSALHGFDITAFFIVGMPAYPACGCVQCTGERRRIIPLPRILGVVDASGTSASAVTGAK